MLSVWTFLATITVFFQDLAAPAYAAVIDEYILVGQAKNYSDAQSYCTSEYDTDLASIHSDGDNNACKALCATVGNTKIDCWIGLSNIEQEGVFVFEDQSEFDYGTDVSGGVLPWSNYNNKSNPSGGSENCVELLAKDGYNWNDQQCSTENYFLCNANSNSGRPSTTVSIPTTSQDPVTTLSTSIVWSTLQSVTSTAAGIAETLTSIVATSTGETSTSNIIQSLVSATGERASQTKSPTGNLETTTSTSERQTQARQSSSSVVDYMEITSIAIVASVSGCVALAAVAMCLAVYWRLQQSGKKQKEQQVEGEEEDKAQPQQDFDLQPGHGVPMVIVYVQQPVPQPTLTPPRPTLTPQAAPRKGEGGGPDLYHELQYELQRHKAEGERSSVLNTTNAVASQIFIAAHENDSDDDSFSDAYKQTAQTTVQ